MYLTDGVPPCGKRNGTRRTILWLSGVLLIGFISLTWIAFRRDMRAAHARVSSGSRIAQTRCGPIEYAVAGEGPPALVVHGAGGGFDQALEMFSPLRDAGFQLIGVSRFGYLRTPLPKDAGAAAQADAHACLLDFLRLRNVCVLGGSAGASSSVELCVRHPERCSALVLAVPMAYIPQPAHTSKDKLPPAAEFVFNHVLRSDFLFWASTRVLHDTLVKTILATPPDDVSIATREERERVDRVLRKVSPISQRDTGIRNDTAVIAGLARPDLERISAPTLIMSVENDQFGTFARARYTAAHVPGARFLSYRTGGHLWVGHQKEFWREVVSFLRNRTQQANAVSSSD
jgi:2-hydroxy-6-oxonona-2,4-dienedioate hydrolase